jgi:hypothetical protein
LQQQTHSARSASRSTEGPRPAVVEVVVVTGIVLSHEARCLRTIAHEADLVGCVLAALEQGGSDDVHVGAVVAAE